MIRPNFSRKTIHEYLKQERRKIEAMILKALQRLGEQAVNHARSNYSYKDQTGNLTASFGYAIYLNGRVIYKAGASNDGKRGFESTLGSIKIASGGFVLIVVAGMNYAMHVEAMGKNVLGATELMVINEFPKALERLKTKINSFYQ